MSGDCIKTFKLEVEIQENGIIRDPFGWIIGRCNKDWLELVIKHNTDCHPYEQRIVGDGSDWGEIMCSAFDALMAAACDACALDELKRFEAHIMKEMGE